MNPRMSRAHAISSNDELVNKLIKRGFIKTMDVEKVFRSVDRRLYITNEETSKVYRDTAWKSEKIYLSAPFIYATVLESLELKPGNTFLNIGSGIGYFSTLAGLLLGVNGINHGIEIHQSLIDCAYQKLEEFKLNSAAIDYYHFCEPVFIQGNVCKMSPMGFYDRVYCGVNVLAEQFQFMMSLIKIDGILVISWRNFLFKITKKDIRSWKTAVLINAPLTNIVVPEDFCSVDTIKFPPVEPLSLQKLCRSSIRSLLRENLKNLLPSLQMCTICPLKNKIIQEQNCLRFVVASSADRVHFSYTDGDVKLISMYSGQMNDNTAQTSDESTKIKSPEAGCSEQNETATESEVEAGNPKRMELNKSPEKMESVPSPSSNDAGDLSHKIAILALVQDEDKYCFISDRKENELSKLLKDKINSLPIPTQLKAFLNYNLVD